MNSGAPTFGTPEAALITYGAGQLARRLNLPYRSAGAFCGSKLPDAQAAYESANSLNMGLLSGVNFMLHACGWLEGGLVASPEKFVMDADQLGILHHMAKGVDVSRTARRWTRSARWGRAAITSAARIRRPTSRMPSGGPRPARLQAVRDLVRRRRARHPDRARPRAGRPAAGGLCPAAARPRNRRGAGRVRRAPEGGGARRLQLSASAASRLSAISAVRTSTCRTAL
jgi:hypothetical protein